MIKVRFKEYRQYGALFCGIFILVMGLFLSYIIITHPHNKIGFSELYAIFGTISFYIMGIFLSTYCYLYPKTGIKEVSVGASNILITAYNEETKKEYTLNLQKSEILSCKVNINCQKDIKITRVYIDILIDLNIVCREDKHQISFHTEDYHKVKQIFSVAKYFPNFSYEVNTNADECKQNIIKLSKTGKNLSLIEYFSAYFANPNVSTLQKVYIKFLFLLMVFLSFIAILMIASIIKDLFN